MNLLYTPSDFIYKNPVQSLSLAVLWSDHSRDNLVSNGAFTFFPRAREQGWLAAVTSC